MTRRRVMLTGASGQVARAVTKLVPPEIELFAFGHAELDITDPDTVTRCVDRVQPDAIVNAAAYTAVDKAEADRIAARLGNESGPSNLAAALARRETGRLLHLSTDFVFDGAASQPYAPHAATRPISVYGETKLAGERGVAAALGARATILRTAWVYSPDGSNFVLTMLRLMARGPVRVVADQVGTPTSATSLARVIWRILAADAADAGGVWHWSDAGVASWYDFAVAIAEEASARGMLAREVQVTPIPSSEYPTPARRPAYSVLDKTETARRFGLEQRHWRANLRDVIEEIRRA